jgi:hypothetical protein
MLKLYDSNLYRLEYKDCYRAAKEDKDHTLYLIVLSQQTKEEKAVESAISLIPLSSISQKLLLWCLSSTSAEHFLWYKEQNKRRLYTSLQAQTETDFEHTAFFVTLSNIL